MNNQISWDDLNIVLAISESGSLSGAGRRLGLSHATVYRRLAKIEDYLGVELFERRRSGYATTAAGEEVAAAAGRIELEFLQVERRVAGRDLRPSGTLRVTTTDTLLSGFLSPIFRDFRVAHHGIVLEVALSNDVLSLSKREADVALRPCAAPPEALVGRRIGSIAQAIYGARDLISDANDVSDFSSMAWIGPDERMAYRLLDKWMADQGLTERCRYRLDSLLGMFAAARDGAGLAVLPCYLGDSDSELFRIGETIPELATDLWLLTHSDLRRTARVRVFMDFVAESATGFRSLLAGESSSPRKVSGL